MENARIGVITKGKKIGLNYTIEPGARDRKVRIERDTFECVAARVAREIASGPKREDVKKFGYCAGAGVLCFSSEDYLKEKKTIMVDSRGLVGLVANSVSGLRALTNQYSLPFDGKKIVRYRKDQNYYLN